MRRLAHLANRAPVEREGRGVDDRFVSVVERLQSMRSVEVEPAFRCSQDRDAPVALVRVLDEARDQVVERARLPDRVARDDRDSADDAVGDERVVVAREEVGLVEAERERREGVGAVIAD